MNVVDEVVDDAVEAAAEATRGAVPTDDDAVAERILEAAAMPRADYERARKSIASKLDIRVSVLDGLVKAARQASGEEQARTSQRDEIVRIARKQGDLWRDDSEAAFATVKVNGHREHYRVKSTAYRRLLVRAYGDQNTVDGAPTAPGSQALTEALTTIDAIAARGPLDLPKLRIGGSVRGPVYLDLGGDSWNAVEVTSTGWSVVPDPPVPFIRAPGMLPLLEPKRGRGGEKLKNHLGIDGANYRLVVGWLLGTFMPRGPYALLAVHGEEGSGKSTLTQMCRRLIDPNRAAERARPKDEHDLVIAASNAWLVCFGNLSSVDDKLSDAMCRISTGSGFATRTLYTNDDETIFQACRPQMVNGIPDLARSGDLVDRCVTILLPSRDEALRSYEDDLWHEFEADLPEMLGYLLDCVSCALSRLPDVKLSRRPRLVDFARWVEAAAPALGWEPEKFLADYVKNRETSARTVVEGDAAGPALLRALAFAPNHEFNGTSTELLSLLSAHGTDEEKRSKRWPNNPTAMGIRLRRIAPALRKLGAVVDLEGRASDSRGIIIRYNSEEVSQASQASPPGAGNDTRDTCDTSSLLNGIGGAREPGPRTPLRVIFPEVEV